MSEKVFAKGLYAKAKNEKAPAFVKGSLSIKVEDFITFLNEHKNDAGYVNLDLLENKTDPSKWSATLNDFKPDATKKDDNYPF
jgi:hypothetical protein